MLTNDFDNFPKENYGINDFSVSIATSQKEYYYHYKENELYDLASITKLFTLNLIYDLEKDGKLKFEDNIQDYLDLPYLSNFTIMDALKMKGRLWLDGKLSDTKNSKEFLERLKTVRYKQIEKEAEYTDIGFILLGFVIEKVTGFSLQKNYELLFEKLELYHTKILPKGYVLKGNGNDKGLPHDFKTRIFGCTGAAGVFSNVKDLTKYAKQIMAGEIYDKSFLEFLFSYQFKDSKGRNRTLAGLYKYTEDVPCYIEKEYSKKSLAHQGFTGGVFILDFEHQFINIFLCDAIVLGEKTKQENFHEGYRLIQSLMKDITFQLYNKKNKFVV